MKDIIEKFKTTRLLAIIGIAGLILGNVLPYYKIWGYSISLAEYWEGKIVMILAIANLLFIFQDVVEKYAPSLFTTTMGRKIKELNNPKLSLVPTVLSVIFAAWLTFDLGVKAFKYYSIGFYVLWIGAISLVAYAFLHKNEESLPNDMYRQN